jgi:tripartite-type tricarboxylate transporter receptor subunit TctC
MMLFSLVLFLLGCLTFGSASAAKFPFKNGDKIVLTVPFAPGGGFDTYTRLLAPPLEKVIEKMGGINVSCIVKNLPGAGGRVAHEKVFRSKPNGRTMLLAHGGALPYHQVIYKARLETSKYTYLGQISEFRNSIVVRSDLPINSFWDLVKRSQKQPILMASAGVGDDPHISPLLIKAFLKEEGIEWNMDFVQFEGTAPARASLPRKETEAIYTVIGSLYPIVASGDGKFIIVFAKEREEKVPKANQIMEAVSSAWTMVGPPKMPAETTKVLREAIKAVVNGKEFLGRAKKAKRTVFYRSGPESQQLTTGKVQVIKRYEGMIKDAMGLK